MHQFPVAGATELKFKCTPNSQRQIELKLGTVANASAASLRFKTTQFSLVSFLLSLSGSDNFADPFPTPRLMVDC